MFSASAHSIAFLDSVDDTNSEFLNRVREKRARPADSDFDTKLLKTPDVGARDARMKYVATNTDTATFQVAEVVAQCQKIEKTLCRMLVRPIAGI
jgi:hypothetical protein